MPPPTKVVIHPIVLLSTVDHYNRVGRETRVVGALLGKVDKDGVVDVFNSFAVPFDEDIKDDQIWFLDHNYLEEMFRMLIRISAGEKIVGWYSTGPKIRSSDLDIHENVFRRYVKDPVFVIIDVQPRDNELGIPTTSYVAMQEVEEGTQKTTMQFQHILSEIGALEAEEIGVEHLLRDVKDTSVSSLAKQITEKLSSLKSLVEHLKDMHAYLVNVSEGKLPINHEILSIVQNIFNLLPNLKREVLVTAFNVKSNDMLLVLYISSMIRSILALHMLINNKLANRAATKKEGEDKEKEKDKEEKDEKDEQKKEGKKEGKEGEKKEGGKEEES
mmetsp:Transcript_20561/g.28395  ORF Transcript_20561/g.28395 Transcript_20561/m.28395 type:complete len:330 (-) Transcript_20561:96-1085(-)|eukprot:CAMPEP_0201491556 /NCGR_PEP_ID=MMETSP0151_2-20130828/30253_1 /ASSEMBLY_ACC=CAM_ASM_000257 /TAXON_ID=200890 /ORGANISM="Paramoeba atlantica, Strain 621/1 / CCAP 1560/9" /LENGTH=329 /DNA_ID=CAMNT_0047877963 /DNA_START=53 /DNA_END=1042 /DNA_ORIENTATION=+